jgi:hypothetical protein
MFQRKRPGMSPQPYDWCNPHCCDLRYSGDSSCWCEEKIESNRQRNDEYRRCDAELKRLEAEGAAQSGRAAELRQSLRRLIVS